MAKLDQVSLSNILSFCMKHEVFFYHSLVCKSWYHFIYSLDFYNYYSKVTAIGYEKLMNPIRRIDKVFNYFEIIRHSSYEYCLKFDDLKKRIYSNQEEEENRLIIVGNNGEHYSFYKVDCKPTNTLPKFNLEFYYLNGRIASDSELDTTGVSLIVNEYRKTSSWIASYSCLTESHVKLKNFYESLELKISFVSFLAIIECYLKGMVYEGNNLGDGDILETQSTPTFLMACTTYVNYIEERKDEDIRKGKRNKKLLRLLLDFPKIIPDYSSFPNQFSFFKRLVDLGYTWTKEEFEKYLNKYKRVTNRENYVAYYAKKRNIQLSTYFSYQDLKTLNFGPKILKHLLNENVEFPKVITCENNLGGQEMRNQLLKYHPDTTFPFILEDLTERMNRNGRRICILEADAVVFYPKDRFSVKTLPKRSTLTFRSRRKFKEQFIPTIKDYDNYILFVRSEHKSIRKLIDSIMAEIKARPLILCLEGRNVDEIEKIIMGIEAQVVCCNSFYCLKNK